MKHEVTEDCVDTHCFWHEIDEPVEGSYIQCFECGHVYRTAGQLRRAYRREYWETTGKWSKPFGEPGFWPPLPARLWRLLTIKVKEINFCQECIHDFQRG